MELFNNILRECRRRGTTVYAIEKKAGLQRGSVYKWKDHIPRVDKVKKVAEALDTSIDVLVE